MRIVFMGTPEFAVTSLDALYKKGYEIVAVITAPDKPAGRGHQVQESAVKKYAVEKGLMVLQPEKLKDPGFIETYRALRPDLNIVVAFRMLPEVIWSYPPLGTFNLHASLLPQYRGAAPINRALMNGETETGVTTFFIDKEIDTGKIMLREKVIISPTMNAGELHDILMHKGAELVIKTVENLQKGGVSLTEQAQLIENENIMLKHAPKIFKEDVYIDISSPLAAIYNHIRGLSPYPAAIIGITDDKGQEIALKVYSSHAEYFKNTVDTGIIATDGKTFAAIEHPQGRLYIDELQFPGKKRLSTAEFLRGYALSTGKWKVKPL